MIERHLADWFRKPVAERLSESTIPDAAGVAEKPMRQTAEALEGHAAKAIPDRDEEGRREIERSGFDGTNQPRPAEVSDRSSVERSQGGGRIDAESPDPTEESSSQNSAASPSASTGYTPNSRREWFQRQFREGTLDPGNLAAAKVIIMDERGQVLMLKSPYETKRTVPGGFVDNGWRKGETPEEAVSREVREELGEEFGRVVKIERLLATNRKSPDPDHGRDYPLTDYIYLATFDESAHNRVSEIRFAVDTAEVTDYGFLPPDEAVRSAGRKGVDVSAALQAHHSGTTIHLVDGASHPPGI